MNKQQETMLVEVLEREFVPHLPALLDTTKPLAEQQTKNRSRALSGFALHRLCGLDAADAARAVVDDFDDCGIDAIYYQSGTRTLFLVQGKLKPGKDFQQAEAQKFVAGVKKLVKPDLAGFNAHVTFRSASITAAVEECDHIQLVVAHLGQISVHAAADIHSLLTDPEADERRYRDPVVDFGPGQVMAGLVAGRAHPTIQTTLALMKARHVEVPRSTYFGLIWLRDLVALYDEHGEALFDRNIRNHLGDKTPVNAAIRASLEAKPDEFFYLNNGVTALASSIKSRNSTGAATRLDVREFSVINGAQTIATAARSAHGPGGLDIGQAKLALTIIQADTDGEFGKRVTRARNYQNEVAVSGFAALDDRQEDIRRQLDALGIRYRYKSDGDTIVDPDVVRFEDAVTALALLNSNPRMAWRLKERRDDLQTYGAPGYAALFDAAPSGFRIANAVRVSRFLLGFMREAIANTRDIEREGNRHGLYAFAWVLAKRARDAIDGDRLLDLGQIAAKLGPPADELREDLRAQLEVFLETEDRRPWAVLRNQETSIALLESLMLSHYGVPEDAALASKRAVRPVRIVRGRAVPLYDYPEPLFTYLASKAPQIDLTT
ncbi:AIPR family protein [Sphingomonas adhaesiva]|uniref:AIPR family protein n=1 Tax=Sphingomonas adhaesiva TaxID=28212 RepID=UPI002FF74F4A